MRTKYANITISVSLQELQLLWACQMNRQQRQPLPGLLDKTFCNAVLPSFIDLNGTGNPADGLLMRNTRGADGSMGFLSAGNPPFERNDLKALLTG